MRGSKERQPGLRRAAVLMMLVGALTAAVELGDGQPPWMNSPSLSAFACGASCWIIAEAGAPRRAAWVAGGVGVLAAVLAAVLAVWRVVVR